MAHPCCFHLVHNHQQAHDAAQRLFEHLRAEIEPLLPASAEILHIGATAVPGCLTKGDLDVVVRVDRDDYPAAEAKLADRFLRNRGSVRNEEFAAFEDPNRVPHLGIQLTTKGSDLDLFHLFTAALVANPELVGRYNAIKLAYHGRPMDEYRAVKDAFVSEVLRSRPR
ncbi:GrpB family protein [Bradyrhizobium sp. STM 3809]|uniref:GrpB family protein n=1 Tax=Bradyrhizobium sp. STM 3809 TaxID=551936 RepID=UPI0002409D2A|nr:GrpB family protein [Bradyrhizobium sp. STM 3809]CCE01692.1 conserved hypothetical protein [Bradyrhizobium sp. STM 3809]